MRCVLLGTLTLGEHRSCKIRRNSGEISVNKRHRVRAPVGTGVLRGVLRRGGVVEGT